MPQCPQISVLFIFLRSPNMYNLSKQCFPPLPVWLCRLPLHVAFAVDLDGWKDNLYTKICWPWTFLPPTLRRNLLGGLFSICLLSYCVFCSFLLVWHRGWMLMTESLDFFQAFIFGQVLSVGTNTYLLPCPILSSPQYDMHPLFSSRVVGRVRFPLKISVNLSIHRGFLGRHRDTQGASLKIIKFIIQL